MLAHIDATKAVSAAIEHAEHQAKTAAGIDLERFLKVLLTQSNHPMNRRRYIEEALLRSANERKG